MNALSRKLVQIALMSAFALPLTSLAADKSGADQTNHDQSQAVSSAAPGAAAQASPNDIQERMHARMLAMQNTSDPEARQALMMAQMADMSAMMAGMSSGCPMAQGMGDKGMMGGGMMNGGTGGMMGGGNGGMTGNAKPDSSAK